MDKKPKPSEKASRRKTLAPTFRIVGQVYRMILHGGVVCPPQALATK